MNTIVPLMNSEMILTEKAEKWVRDSIVGYLSPKPDGAESVSYLVEWVRDNVSPNFPTRKVDAEAMFEALGFKLVRIYNKRKTSIVRTDVTL